MPTSDELSTLREGAVSGAVAERRQVAVSGPDRAAFLQGLLTNDITALSAGQGCYAAWLTPQGRMLTDLHVLESGDMLLLDVPLIEVESVAGRLEQFHFTEDVRIADLSASLESVWVHGPSAPRVLASLALSDGALTDEMLASWSNYQNVRATMAGLDAVVARIDQLDVPGYVVYVGAGQGDALTRALAASGAQPAAPDVIEAARIEACYPLFGVDMTADTIPLEADIQDRAISLTKGCYVGQEVIIRVLHRGHGRVARKLVGLHVDGAVPARDAKIFAGDRDIGFVTSAARSPRLGSIALGYVQRDFVEPGTVVEVSIPSGRAAATIRAKSAS
jgi:folate-binding protein YgfZ